MLVQCCEGDVMQQGCHEEEAVQDRLREDNERQMLRESEECIEGEILKCCFGR